MKSKAVCSLVASMAAALAGLLFSPPAAHAQQGDGEAPPVLVKPPAIPAPPIPVAPGDPGPPQAMRLEFNVAVQSEIPQCTQPLPSPVPRLLQILSLLDQGKFEFFGSYYSPHVIQKHGLQRLVDENLRPWHGELRENGGLEKVVVKRIAFEADQAFVTYVVVERNGNTDNETTGFILGEDGQWYLRDRDL